MRHIRPLILTLIVLLVVLPGLTQAAELQQFSLKLNRLEVSTATSGTVCASPATDANESKVEVTFPPEFSVNSTASNWTTTTNDIPAGATAWPGISTATSVSGTTVTFPTLNLNVGVLYCFNFPIASTLTNPSTTGYYNGVITTKDSSNNEIDSGGFAVPILDSDSVTVNAAVGIKPENLLFDLSSPSGTNFSQNSIIDYEITYGQNAPFAIAPTITVSWGLGEITNTGGQVEVLHYVHGSATNAFSNTPPVIDLINRTITWTISSLPANTTNKTIRFKLATNSEYTGPNKVNMQVSGRISYRAVSSPLDIVGQTYQYSVTPATPTPIPNPTPKPKSDPFTFTDVGLKSISSSQAEITVTTSKFSKISLSYGSSSRSLPNKVTSLNLLKTHNLIIDNLSEGKPYYFRLEAISDDNRRLVSDIFTFKTASTSEKVELSSSSVVLASGNVILYASSQDRKNGVVPLNVLPKEKTIDLKLTIPDSAPLKQIQTFFVDNSVLGINNLQEEEIGANQIIMTELSEGEYLGKLMLPSKLGIFRVLGRIIDYKGNVSEETLASIKVVEPLKIVDERLNPVENARVHIHFYNPKLHIFEQISSQMTSIMNPTFSEADGVVNLILPKGKYKAVVDALGFEERTVEFDLDSANEGVYPTITIKRQPFSIVSFAKYHYTTALDLLHAVRFYARGFAQSNRLFDLLSLLIISLFIYLVFRSISVLKHIKLTLLPRYFKDEFNKASFLLRNKLRKKSLADGEEISTITGSIIDFQTKTPIRQAQISLLDNSQKIINQTLSNIKGHFSIGLLGMDSYSLLVTKKGYEAKNLEGSIEDKSSQNPLKVSLEKHETKVEQATKTVKVIFWDWLSSGVEMLVIFCIVMSLFYITTIGAKALPLLVIALINHFLWLVILKREV